MLKWKNHHRKEDAMKRKLLSGLLAALILTLPAHAQRSIPVQVDGTLLSARCYVDQGVTYVPLRTLLDAFGGWTIYWDSQSAQAVAHSEDTTLRADPDADTITAYGKTVSGRVTVEKGRTYVPARLVAELLKASAQWDPYLDGAAITSPGADFDAVDLYWLSRVIYAESGAESQEGQIAVGSVVMNRIRSEEFPDTVADVVFDSRHAVQFEPVENGTIYHTPSAEARESARLVLQGARAAGESLYFYAPALSQGIWINDNRTYYTTIGCHRFYL